MQPRSWSNAISASSHNPALVVLTRDPRGNAAWRPALEQAGHPVYELPCIQLGPAELNGEVLATLENLDSFHWVAFTSANSIRYLSEIAAISGVGLQSLTRCRIAAVGQATGTAVKAQGLRVNLIPTRADATTLARELKYIKNRRVLLLRSEAAESEPAEILRDRGAEVTDLAVYRTLPVAEPDPAYEPLLTFGQIGAHVFASPTAVDGLSRRLSEPALVRARSLPAIAIGSTTTAAAESAGFLHTHTAPEPSVLGVIRILSDTISAV